MTELIALFLNNLLPIFLAAGAGFLLSQFLNVNPRTLSQIIFYIFSPCLIFSLLVKSRLSDGDILRMVLFSASIILLIGLITWVIGKSLKLDRKVLAGVIITSMFMNAGNYGLPVVNFAFGDVALGYASLFFVTNAALAYLLGVVIASMGSTSFLKALGNLLKIPIIYALILAIIIIRNKWHLPLPLERTVSLLGDASIPAMLVLLGMQFKTATWRGKFIPVSIASAMRLLVAPLIALLLSPVFGISGAARQAGVLEAAMPTAVLTTVLATEYDAAPSLVTGIVFISTLLSPFTLTPLLALLGA